MQKKILLNTPENKNYIFYQCIDTNCHEITDRIYKVMDQSTLRFVPKNIPKNLHQYYLKFDIYSEKFYDKIRSFYK